MEPEPIDHEDPAYELNAVLGGIIWNEAIDLTFDDAFIADHYTVEDYLDQCTSKFEGRNLQTKWINWKLHSTRTYHK